MTLLTPSRFLRAAILAVVIALECTAAPGLRAEEIPNEYEIKAVMLFNLARFVEWPAKAFAETNSPIIIGILGRNPFGEALPRAVQGETVNGRRLVIEHSDSLRPLENCHILFISSSEKSKLPQILSKLEGKPVLTVSELDGFSKQRGGMVRFYVNEQKKIRLKLNLQSARTEGLGVSSKLIQVAELDTTSLLRPRGPTLAMFWPAHGLSAFPLAPFVR
jgi:hypothetical protein